VRDAIFVWAKKLVEDGQSRSKQSVGASKIQDAKLSNSEHLGKNQTISILFADPDDVTVIRAVGSRRSFCQPLFKSLEQKSSNSISGDGATYRVRPTRNGTPYSTGRAGSRPASGKFVR